TSSHGVLHTTRAHKKYYDELRICIKTSLIIFLSKFWDRFRFQKLEYLILFKKANNSGLDAIL
ncbi:hypothetical protein, partial [Leptospira borgpetersenii]